MTIISFDCPDELIKKLDDDAEENGTNRSIVIRNIVKRAYE